MQSSNRVETCRMRETGNEDIILSPASENRLALVGVILFAGTEQHTQSCGVRYQETELFPMSNNPKIPPLPLAGGCSFVPLVGCCSRPCVADTAI
jgi:hypothetical protein